MRKNSRARLLAPLLDSRRARRDDDAHENPALEAIWDVVARIPRGRVSTYGDVARAAGLPGRARLAGYALRHMPEDMELPWHRVVGAGGKIVFPRTSREFREQARRLRVENVAVTNGRVPRAALLEGLPGD